jgi:hypothetical protein
MKHKNLSKLNTNALWMDKLLNEYLDDPTVVDQSNAETSEIELTESTDINDHVKEMKVICSGQNELCRKKASAACIHQ